MTKEELEKEAEDYAREWLYHVKDLELHHKEDDEPKYIRIKEAYLAGAELREKRITELSNHIVELQKDKGELTDKVKELEAQIEKMKTDVKQGQSYWNSGEMQYDLYQRLLDKWEIKEK